MVDRKTQNYALFALLLFFIAALTVPALGDSISAGNESITGYSPYIPSNQSILYERGAEWEDYLNPDGSHSRKIYTGLMNYWNGTGYEPIDTTIVEENGAFKVEKGAYKVQWSNGKGFKFQKDRYYLSYQGKEISKGKSKKVLASIKEGEGKKDKNKIKFKEIYPSTDVEYIYYPDLLKENIILNKAPDLPADQNLTLDFSGHIEYSEELEIWINGTKQENSFSTSEAIEFRAGDEVEFTLLPPVIEDSNNSRITGEYELVRENGRNLLSVKVPYEWLINSSRVYPVVVDPSTSIRNSGDTFVNQLYANTNFGYEEYLEVQSWYFSNERILLRFPLTSPLPPGATITSANLKMNSSIADTGRTIDVWSVDNYWFEYTVTWNNQPPNITKLASGSSGLGLRSWTITSEVLKKWGKPLFLELIDSAEDNKGWYKYQRYYSWEYHNRTGQPMDPYIEVFYTTPQNDCGISRDASNTFNDADYVSLPKTCSGYLEIPDRSDYYKFQVTAGYTIDASLIPPSGANFNLYLYDSNYVLKKWSIITGDASESISYVADSSGEWRIEVYQVEGSGTYSLSTVQADKTPPPAPVISSSTHPDQNRWYSNKNPSFTWVASDASGIAGYSYDFDQSSSTIPDDTVEPAGNSKSYSGNVDGVWYFHVKAKDNAGYWGTVAHYQVNIDVTSPSAPVISSSTHPEHDKWYGNNNPSFTWVASDASGIEGYSYELDQSPLTTPSGALKSVNSESYFSKADGIWYFHIRAKDNAGNWGPAAHYKLMIDKTPPPVPDISSSTHQNQNIWYSNKNPSFTWTTPPDASGIAGYSYDFDQSSSTIPDDTVEPAGNSKSYSGKVDGVWYFHIRAKDNAGNWGAVAHYTVRIDVTPPSVHISTPANNSIFNSSDILVSWSGSDSNSGIEHYEIRLDNGGWTSINLETHNPFIGLGDGTHKVAVRAIDMATNQAETSVSFTIQSLPDLFISNEDITFEKVG